MEFAEYVTGNIDWEIPEDGELPKGLPMSVSLTLVVDDDGWVDDIIDEDMG